MFSLWMFFSRLRQLRTTAATEDRRVAMEVTRSHLFSLWMFFSRLRQLRTTAATEDRRVAIEVTRNPLVHPLDVLL